MSRLVLVLTFLLAALAACGSTPPQPSPSPSQPVERPSTPAESAPPTITPPEATPSASPAPTGTPVSTPAPIATPRPTPSQVAVTPTVEEAYLLAGVRADLIDCRPLRQDLPSGTTGAIECGSADHAVARVGFFLFDGTVDVMSAYWARMDAEGVQRDTVACESGEGEAAYMPGDDEVESRHGCFVNSEGFANYRATAPSYLMYIGVLGKTGNMRALVDFAWRGNDSVPGYPTLWAESAD